MMLIDGCGSDDDDEQHGQDAEDEGKQHLDRHLHRLFLGTLAPLDSHLLCLGSEDAWQGNSVRVCLDHGPDEAPEIRDIDALCHGQIGILAASTDLHILECANEFLRQRALSVLARACHRRFESKPASTEISIWSRVFGSSISMAFWRSAPRPWIRMSGTK